MEPMKPEKSKDEGEGHGTSGEAPGQGEAQSGVIEPDGIALLKRREIWPHYVAWLNDRAANELTVAAYVYFSIACGAPNACIHGVEYFYAGHGNSHGKVFEESMPVLYWPVHSDLNLHEPRAFRGRDESREDGWTCTQLIWTDIKGHRHDAEQRTLNALSWKIIESLGPKMLDVTSIGSALKQKYILGPVYGEVMKFISGLGTLNAATLDAGVSHIIRRHVRAAERFHRLRVEILGAIVGHLRAKTYSAAIGTVVVATSKGPCESCRRVVDSFRQLFPGVRVIIVYPRRSGERCEIDHDCGRVTLGYPWSPSGQYRWSTQQASGRTFVTVEFPATIVAHLRWNLSQGGRHERFGVGLKAGRLVCCAADIVTLVRRLRNDDGLAAAANRLGGRPSGSIRLLLRKPPCEVCRFILKYELAAAYPDVSITVAYLADPIPAQLSPAPPQGGKRKPRPWEQKLLNRLKIIDHKAPMWPPVLMIFDDGRWHRFRGIHGYLKAELDLSISVHAVTFTGAVEFVKENREAEHGGQVSSDEPKRVKVTLSYGDSPAASPGGGRPEWGIGLMCQAGVAKLRKVVARAHDRRHWGAITGDSIDKLADGTLEGWDTLVDLLIAARTKLSDFPSIFLMKSVAMKFRGNNNLGSLLTFMEEHAVRTLKAEVIRTLLTKLWEEELRMEDFVRLLEEQLPGEVKESWQSSRST